MNQNNGRSIKLENKELQSASNQRSYFNRISSSSWLPEVIALLSGILFLIQGWIYSHTQQSALDEGAYLSKGYLFVTGQYSIYQDYGPWSNHMPLSFFIPGYIQYIFGPGVGVARYFSLLLAGLMLLGIWMIANRFGGKWWGAAAVFVFAINPSVIKMYSVAVPQVLIACMLVWILVLVLGDGRPLWQIVLGSLLAGLMLMTRINMLPVLPLLLLYVFWQHGVKAGILSTIVTALTVTLGHLLFWPDILKIWAKRLPQVITPFLDPYRYHIEITDIWNPQVTLLNRLLSFLYSLRIHFVPLIGALTACLLWPRKSKWKSSSHFRASVFLLSLFLVLLLIHLWAALGQDYCVFCLDGYIAYFSMLGVLLVIVSFSSWRRQLPLWYQVFLAAIILVICAGIGFGAFEDIGDTLFNIQIPRFLIDFSNRASGFVPLGAVLINKFNFEYAALRRFIPILFGLGVGVLVIIFALGTRIILLRRNPSKPGASPKTVPSFGYLAMVIFLIVGTLLTPTGLFAGGGSNYDCTGDVISSYRETGEYLAYHIPPGSKVYWKGGLSAVPLLYVPGIEIYPSQLNDGYSFKIEGDTEQLHKWGFWNKEIALRWLEETDFVLIEQRSFHGWHKDALSTGKYEELEPTPPQVQCRSDSWIRIFKRIK